MFSLKLNDIFEHKYSFLATAALFLIPAYSWKSFFKYKNKLKHDYEQEVLFQKRHNCVVTYQANKGLSGWPPYIGRAKASNEKLFEELYEPILYFIRTAEKSLDVAIMIISVNVIYSELIKARRRGVKIRILCNLQHTISCRNHIKDLMEEGVECLFFVATSAIPDSIMHNKYMIKDYNENGGFVCMGSLNFSTTSVLNNYEFFVFMSNYNVVEAFENNFEECWQNIAIDNKGLINKTILIDAQLDS